MDSVVTIRGHVAHIYHDQYIGQMKDFPQRKLKCMAVGSHIKCSFVYTMYVIKNSSRVNLRVNPTAASTIPFDFAAAANQGCY